MICSDEYRDGVAVDVLICEEIILLRSCVNGLHLLAKREQKPGFWITGSDGADTCVPEDPAREARIPAAVRNRLPESALDREVVWHTPACPTASISPARRGAATRPESGGVVTLESAEDVASCYRFVGDVLTALVSHVDGGPTGVPDAARRTSDRFEALRLGISEITPSPRCVSDSMRAVAQVASARPVVQHLLHRVLRMDQPFRNRSGVQPVGEQPRPLGLAVGESRQARYRAPEAFSCKCLRSHRTVASRSAGGGYPGPHGHRGWRTAAGPRTRSDA